MMDQNQNSTQARLEAHMNFEKEAAPPDLFLEPLFFPRFPRVRSSLSCRRLDDRRRRRPTPGAHVPPPGLLRALRRRRVRPPLLIPSCYAKLSIQTLA